MKQRFWASPSFVPVAMILGAIVGLAVMGLAFCWACPDRLHDVGGVASRWCFKRQLAWNVIGLAALVGAIVVGWKRWLKEAPFVFIGWVALWFVAHMQQMVDGSCNIVRIGPIPLQVWSLFPVAFALLAAWLRDRYGVRLKRVLFAALLAVLAGAVIMVATDPGRKARLAAFVAGEEPPEMPPGACARAFVQHQSREAFAQAHWFSPCDTQVIRDLPGAMKYSMPASSAVVFGKRFMSVACVFFAIVALGLACLWRGTEDKTKRAFIFVAGLGILVPAILGPCECLGLMPMLYTCVPLVSNETTAVLASWLGAGILASASRTQSHAGFPIPSQFPSSMAHLRALVAKGASARWGTPLPKDVADRLEFELFTIDHLFRKSPNDDVVSRFLIAQDCVAAARRMGVWVGPGRGAMPGSAVAYALGITAVDPIRHGLLFEMFLNPDRISTQKIEIDFDDMGREKVLQYVDEKYGRGHFDVLGLAALSQQKDCVRLIKERAEKSVDLERIPENDEATMAVFANADTAGISQFESDGMRKWLAELKPSCLKDIAIMNALCRPGLFDYVPTFVRRKDGEEPVECAHPLMEDILRETYGVMVYQDQVVLLSRKLAGFTRAESDKMRKAMSTKRLDTMEALKPKFVTGCLSNRSFRVGKWADESEAKKLIDTIWDGWRSFMSHAVPRSHALCRAWLAYQSAYLKAHHPSEFAMAFGVKFP